MTPSAAPVAVPRWQRVTLALALLVPVGFMVSTVPGVRPEPGYDPLLDGVLNNLAYAMAPVVCVLRTLRDDGPRTASHLLAAALAVYGSGNVVWTLAVRPMPVQPWSSVADVFWLGFYPLALAALLLVLRRRGEPRVSLWLDGLVAALAVGAVAAVALAGPLAGDGGGRWVAVVTTTAYPLLDLALLVVVGVALFHWSWRPPVGLWFLGAGLVLFVGADVAYLLATSEGTYSSGGLTDGVWVLATVLMASTPGWPRRPAGPRVPAWALLTVPVAATAAALGVLVLGHARPLPLGGVVLAAATVVAALARFVVTFREVAALAHSRELALTDELTGLGNRRALYREAPRRIEAAASADPRTGVVLLLADLDRFKEVNDSLGHHVGDALLGEVGARLRSLAPEQTDLVVRLGGDEFAFLGTADDARCAGELAERVRALVQRPVTVDGFPVRVDASIGIAVMAAAAADLPTLLRQADVAMYHAKSHRLGVFSYRADLDAFASGDRLETVELLRSTIAARGLVLHYQPKIRVRDAGVSGVEALVRLDHPTRGLLLPASFLPLADEVGLMEELTEAVLEQAMDQAAAWHRAGLRLPVAVNLSAPSFADPTLPARVAAMLAARRLPPRALGLEITEEALMGDRRRAQHVLAGLREQGVRVAIDDFGTGYSSLAYLKELPIDELKLDRSFVSGVARDDRTRAVIGSVTMLAHSLGLRLVAEGVEDLATCSELEASGCDEQQGWYWARALPAPELERWLGSAGRRAEPASDRSGAAADRVRPA